MIKQYIGQRLYRQLALVIFVALAASGLLYFASAYVMEEAVCAYYARRPEIVRQNAADKIDALQAYVAEHGIAATDGAALSAWVGRNPLLVAQVHQDSRLVFDSTQQRSAALHTHLAEHSPSTTQLMRMVEFVNGMAQVSIAVFPEHTLVDALAKGLLVVCAVLFLCVTLLGVRQKIRYIVQLEREVLSIAGGDLSLPITRYGEDELASLADCIDEMRHSLTQRVEQEEARQRERHDWITSLSHDIRTPLTSLIGYLEILSRRTLPEAEHGYAQKSAKKARQLKQITDMLFASLSPNAPVAEADKVIPVPSFVQGYIAGCADMLRESGFAVHVRQVDPLCESIVIQPAAVQRVFSNICANIAQYASADLPVSVCLSGDGGLLAVRVLSATSARETAHGTGLGLRICENLMRSMGGGFSAQARGDQFEYVLTFACSS